METLHFKNLQEDHPLCEEALKFIKIFWGNSFYVISKHKKNDIRELPAIIIASGKRLLGVITYEIAGGELEIVTLNSKVENLHAGSELVKQALIRAKAEACGRIWLITTNDNTDAFRFYQKRGFDMVELYRNVVIESRKLKPEIPEFGYYGIAIKHEIEMEYMLQ